VSKSLFTLILAAILLLNSGIVFSKTKDAGAPGQGIPTKGALKSQKAQPGDVNQLAMPGKFDRTSRRRQIRQTAGKQKPILDANQPPSKFDKPGTRSPLVEKYVGFGQEHQQQLKALEKQFLHEQAKHLWRRARLNRIRELAAQEGDTKTVELAASLLQMEDKRYLNEQQQIREKRQKILQFADTSSNKPIQKAVKEGSQNKKPLTTQPNQTGGKGTIRGPNKKDQK